MSSPRLDQLVTEGFLFTRAHATAPLYSNARRISARDEWVDRYRSEAEKLGLPP